MVNMLEFEEFVARALGFTKTSEFNLSSYVGGLGFGTGLSLVFTKALRTIFVLASGGLLIILVLNRHGYLNVDFNQLVGYVTNGISTFLESILNKLNLETGNFEFLKTLHQSMTDSQLSSATFGLLTGFTLGLVLL